MAQRVEELKIWQRAQQFAVAVTAILGRPGFLRDGRLRDQIRDATDSILSNIAEGFAQPTDRAFAKYLFTAKASAAEARTRLQIARNRDYMTDDQLKTCTDLGDEVARMMTGLIKYLLRSDRKTRGLGLTGTTKSNRPVETD